MDIKQTSNIKNDIKRMKNIHRCTVFKSKGRGSLYYFATSKVRGTWGLQKKLTGGILFEFAVLQPPRPLPSTCTFMM